MHRSPARHRSRSATPTVAPGKASGLVQYSKSGASTADLPSYLHDLNFAQRAAVEYGIAKGAGPHISGPLLIIAGAGTGKTNTLAIE